MGRWSRCCPGVWRRCIRPIAKPDFVAGPDVQGPGEINGRVFSEHHPGGIEKPQIGIGDGRPQQSVDEGLLSSGHPADDIVYAARAYERGTLAGLDVKSLEAVKQVGAGLGA